MFEDLKPDIILTKIHIFTTDEVSIKLKDTFIQVNLSKKLSLHQIQLCLKQVISKFNVGKKDEKVGEEDFTYKILAFFDEDNCI